MRTSLLLLSLCLFATSVGCSDSLVEVSGTVTVEGEPVESGTISFIPVGEGSPQGGTIEQGKYSAKLSQGEKTVQITGQKKVGEKVHDPTMLDSPNVPVMEAVVPRKYLRDSPLKETISEPNESLNFDLDAK